MDNWFGLRPCRCRVRGSTAHLRSRQPATARRRVSRTRARSLSRTSLPHTGATHATNDRVGARRRHQRCDHRLSIGTLLWLIGVQPALMFGVFAFFGEFLPNIDAFLVAIPILLVALSLGATKFWLALAIIVLVYQIELNVLVPGVLGKEMRLHPVNILFFTLATGTMFGLLGVVLAVPAAALFRIAIDEFYLRPRKPDYAAIDREAAAVIEGKS